MTSLLLAAASLPVIAAAQGPATEATCEGIKAAYPILGASCAKNYATIAKSKTLPELDSAQKLALYQARVAVMQTFRKALLCNGMAGANKAAQQRFQSGEPGHLEAINNLYTSMDPENRPKKVFDADELNNISINKQQCK
ncbi:hypothetical protein [Xanthomonas sp. MUS 060]|uniref:hypothetical protein n=1 Tax=Xanthomonas sp. MUS 060 TaxID=1588031 RepID=UPI0005F2D257|nr:hypothetical protein [Xanthomonas sp. MUS 060]